MLSRPPRRFTLAQLLGAAAGTAVVTLALTLCGVALVRHDGGSAAAPAVGGVTLRDSPKEAAVAETCDIPCPAKPYAGFPRSGTAFETSGNIWGDGGSRLRATSDDGLIITASARHVSGVPSILRLDIKFPAQRDQTDLNENDFSVTLSVPEGQTLVAGKMYEGTRAPFATTGPGLDLSGNGKSNNTLRGWFYLTRIAFDGDGNPAVVEGYLSQLGDDAALARAQFRWEKGIPGSQSAS